VVFISLFFLAFRFVGGLGVVSLLAFFLVFFVGLVEGFAEGLAEG